MTKSPAQSLRRTWKLAAAALFAFAGCGARDRGADHPGASDIDVAGLAAARVVPPSDAQKRLSAAYDAYYRARPGTLTYLQSDKPLYQPGETLWFRAHVAQTGTLAGAQGGVTMQLVGPRGDIVASKRVQVVAGVAANDFVIPPEASGGEFKLRSTYDNTGTVEERSIIIATYEAPRLKKTLEFVKKAYGPGDTVSAAVKVERATGEAFANQPLTGLVTLDGTDIARVALTSDGEGNAIVKFALPAQIERGDGLLTILAEDGGVTESVQKRVPILLKKLALTLYPEGGDLVLGLPSRVYFEAQNTIGKPADVSGVVKDDRGMVVAKFSSIRDGMGRFSLTPHKDRKYHVEITQPIDIATKVDLPAAKATGCTLRAIDAPTVRQGALRVAVSCTQSQTVVASATLRERQLASLTAEVVAGRATLMALPIDANLGAGAQGAVRVTLFDGELAPVAERLIYRGRGQDLKVKVTADKASYGPRDEVSLKVSTTDLSGKPVAASLGVSVVDDTVLSFADDKTANLLAHLYLESEFPAGAAKLDDPNFYFSDKPDAAAALDAVLGTRGYRRFEWQQVLAPPPPVVVTATGAPGMVFEDDEVEGDMVRAEGADVAAMRRPMPAPAAAPPADPAAAQRPVKKPMMGGRAGAGGAPMPVGGTPPKVAQVVHADGRFAKDKNRERANADEAGGDGWAENAGQNQWGWAAVRVFPTPDYKPGFDGPRTDFRETVYWNPSVTTGKDGTATVKFFLSDAVTSFRAIAEGTSLGGLPGRGDVVVTSKLPLSIQAKLPLEASNDDLVRVPVTLSNETTHPIKGHFDMNIGAAFQVLSAIPHDFELAPGERRSTFIPLRVLLASSKDPAMTEIALAVETAGLKDEVKRNVRIVPRGFPQTESFSGSLTGSIRHDVDLTGAMPGTLSAVVTLYPSPLATMLQGGEAMLQEPSGCFEQTSSTNYPNVMVTQYLIAHDVANPVLLQKTQTLLDHGYKKLAGYETPTKGYEWFGGDPGHEALTAYGILEFNDMKKVYPNLDDAMLARTEKWLLGRRDGKGGFQRNSRALDSFGSASPEVTNSYIAYALSEAGGVDLAPEVKAQTPVALQATDPYRAALATNLLLNVKSSDAAAAVSHLKGLQGKDGGFHGADHSITKSGGESLEIETTSLALQALMKASVNGSLDAPVRAGIEFLNKSRGGGGNFGSTQATVLAIKTLNQYAEYSRRSETAGVAEVWVNGKVAGHFAYQQGHKEAIVFDDLSGLIAGHNVIELKLEGGSNLPYSMLVDYRTALPHSAKDAPIDLKTELAKGTTKLGESVRMMATVTNKTDKGQPMTLARVGLPGGLTFQTWQLKELKDKGTIDFYETRPREIILYFRSFAPHAEKHVALDLMPTVPGTYEAPASSAYLYYTNELKTWVAPSKITVKE